VLVVAVAVGRGRRGEFRGKFRGGGRTFCWILFGLVEFVTVDLVWFGLVWFGLCLELYVNCEQRKKVKNGSLIR
jgi:hypothetical protein